MNLLGGFAAVTYIPQSLVDRTIDAIWTALWPSATTIGDVSLGTPLGELELSGAITIEKPQVDLLAAAPGIVNFQTGGYVRGKAQIAGSSANILLRFDCSVDVQLSVTGTLAGTSVTDGSVVIDPSNFDVSKLTRHLIWSDIALPDALQQALTGADLRNWIADRIKELYGDKLKIKLDASAIGDALTQINSQGKHSNPQVNISIPTTTAAGARALGGWIAVGFNGTLDSADQLNGDLMSVKAPNVPAGLEGTAIGAVDADFIGRCLKRNVDYNVRIATGQYRDVHSNNDATVTFLGGPDVGLNVHLTGGVDVSDPFPRLGFSVDVNLRLFISGGTLRPQVDAHLHIARKWYLSILFLDGLFSSIEDYAAQKIEEVNRRPEVLNGLGTSLPLGDFSGVKVRASLSELSIKQVPLDLPGGVEVPIVGGMVLFGYVTVDFNTTGLQPQPEGFGGEIQPNYIGIRERNLRMSYSCPLLQNDPSYFVVYTVKRHSDGHIIATEGQFSGGGADFKMSPIDIWAPDVYLEKQLNLSVSVQRPPGMERFTASRDIEIADKFDRGFRYVRWSTDHVWIDKTKVPQPQHKARKSAVHRTDIHRRCHFCDQPGMHTTRFDHFDHVQTPPPGDMSDRLCPYCFTKQELESPLLILGEEQG